MNKLFRQTMILTASVLMLTISTDMLAWSFSGQYKNTGQSLMSQLLKSVIDLPVKLMYATFNVVIGLIESSVKALLGVVGLKDTAKDIHLHYLETN